MGLSVLNLASLPGSSRPGGGVEENIKPFLSTKEGGEGLSACDGDVTFTYYKNNGDDPLNFGDKIYEDSEGKIPFIQPGLPYFLAYEITPGNNGYYGLTSNVVTALGVCPLPISKFDSTTEPIASGEACSLAIEGTFMYKNGTALIVKGDTIYTNQAGTELAEPGYYKAIFSGISYQYQISSVKKVKDDPIVCEP